MKKPIYNIRSAIYKLRLRTRVALGVIAVLLPIILYAAYHPSEGRATWFDDGWVYRKKIEIKESEVSGSTDLTDFPVLVKIDDDTDLAAGAQSDGDDILFTDLNGSKLDHEIEYYNSSDADLIAWVKIPKLHANNGTGNNTVIYMYYGNPTCNSQENVEQVWSNGFRMVHHMAETSGQHIDSSPFSSDTTAVYVTQQGTATGKIGGADEFNGGNEWLTIANNDALNFTNQEITISAWVKLDTDQVSERAIVRKNDQFQLGIFPATDYIRNLVKTSDSDGWNTSNDEAYTINSETWYYFSFTYNTSYLRHYANGAQVGTDKDVSGNIVPNSSDTSVGASTGGGFGWIDGIIDEVRIANISRTADWFATEYSNQNNPSNFIVVDSQETTPDVIAWWKFDEGYDSSAYDNTAQGKDGTVAGATWMGEDLCVEGKCLYFDGSDDVVTITGTVSGIKSVSFWARIQSVSSTEQLIDLNATDYITSDSGTVTAGSFGTETIYVDGRVGTTVTANRWHLITVTTSTSLSGSAIKIGQLSNNYGQAFIDEVKLYSQERTATQILTDYNRYGAVLGDKTAVFSDGLAGYWMFDETSGNANDTSGNVITLTNNNTTTYNSGKFGQAPDFNGTTQYFEAADNPSLSITGSLTIAAWIKPDDTSGSQNIAGKWDGSNNSYMLALEGDELRMYIEDAANYETTDSSNIVTTKYSHVAGVYDSKTQTVKLYVNGVEQASTTSGTIPSSITDDAVEFVVGADDSPTNYFDGHIDEVRIYNRKLSESEIAQIYNWAPGPVGYWPLDENSGTSTTYDKSGNGNNGAMSVLAENSWVSGKYGSGLDFRNTTERILITDDSAIQHVFDGGGTVQAWIYPRSEGVESGISGKIIQKSSWQLTSYTESGSNMAIRFFQSFNAEDGNWYTGAVVPLNQWSHIAVTYDSSSASNDPTFFVNGIEVTYTDDATVSGTRYDDAGYNLYIGNWSSPYNYTFDGMIDEVKLHNYVRTPQQIVEDMNAGHPAPGSPIGSQMVYWAFDEMRDSTANNSGYGGSSLNGSISSGSWTASGKMSGALTFTASTSVTTTITDPGYSNAISLWAYPTTSAASKTLVTLGKLTTDSSSRPVYGGCTGVTLDTDEWTHIIAVSNGSGECAIYQNGIQTASGTTGVTFGTSIDVGGTSFTGKIDEFKFYNSPLTEYQAKIDYNAGSSVGYGVLGDSEASTLSDGAGNPPYGYWPLNENTGQYVNDISSNGFQGTLGSTSSIETSEDPLWSPGKYGAGLLFDGSGNRARIPKTASVKNMSQFTIQAWFKASGFPASSNYDSVYFEDVNDSAGSTRAALTINNNSDGCGTNVIAFSFRTGNSSSTKYTVCGATTLSTNTWYHASAVFNSDTDVHKVYLNGVEDGSLSQAVSAIENTDPYSLIFVGRVDSSDPFAGYLDDIKLYNYARTQGQIVYDYNRGKPIAHWQLDECQGATAYDASGNGYHGTIAPGASGNTSVGTCGSGTDTEMWNDGTTGKFNGSLGFDGTNDIVSSSTLMVTDYPFSVSGWVKTSDEHSLVFEFGDADQATHQRLAIISGTARAVSYRNSGGGIATGTTTVNDGNWHNLTGVWASITDRKIYVDGNLEGTSEVNVPFDSGIDNWCMGYHCSTLALTLIGQIDDVRVYNYALSANQVKQVMNNASSVFFGPAQGNP